MYLRAKKDRTLSIILSALEISSNIVSIKPRELTSQILARVDPSHESDTGDIFRFLRTAGNLSSFNANFYSLSTITIISLPSILTHTNTIFTIYIHIYCI